MAVADAEKVIAPSQGAHVVLERSFLPGESAIMVPHTSDGRVMFAIPWKGHTVVGTTDEGLEEAALEPVAMEKEIDFILETAGRYLSRPPSREDVLSVFAGIRPLVRAGDGKRTAALSRDHSILIDASGLVTIAGGKWTTYRNMAEDCVDRAATLGGLPERECVTRDLNVHGYHSHAQRFGPLHVYGSEADEVMALGEEEEGLGEAMCAALPITGAQIVWAARHEMARTVEDALARRTRALFLNVEAAVGMSRRAAELMARELGRDEAWVEGEVAAFAEVARGYRAVQKR